MKLRNMCIIVLVTILLMGAKKTYIGGLDGRVSRLEKRLILLTEDVEALDKRVLVLENQKD